MQNAISKIEMPPRAMLAQRYKKFPNGLTLWSEYKADGVRCLGNARGLFTRSGLQIRSCRHIENALREVFAQQPNLVLDGELYSHDLRNDLGAIVALVNRKPTRGTTGAAALAFHIFDIVDTEMKFSRRLARCNELSKSFEGHSVIRFVPAIKVTDETMLDALYERYLCDGYEGQIIRTDEVYIGARSSRLQKRKPFMDAEFALVDLEPIGSKQRPGLRALMKTEGGLEFAAVMQRDITVPVRALSPFAQAVVRYSGRSRTGIPRCATVVAVYPDGRSL
jgi:DNA ligase-1